MNELDSILSNISNENLEDLIFEIQNKAEYKVLKYKTQIKNSAVEKDNEVDKQLTNRKQHSFQVSEIAYNIVKSSGMSEKEALVAQLVGLCHDLGHTPFRT